MNGKQIAKKPLINKGLYFVFAIAVFVLVFTGCDNIFLQDMDGLQLGGVGTFTLEMGGVSTGRTILPATVQGNFAAYTLVFSSTTGGGTRTEDRTNANLGEAVNLLAGTWNLTVTAFMDSARSRPAAQGTLTGIVISSGSNVSGSLELKAIIQSGTTGTFTWNISYPTDVTVASVKITPLDPATGTPEQTVTVSRNTNQQVTLNTGYYHVVFSLSNGSHETGMEEYLHVYQNMPSQFTYTFTQDHFTVYSVTNGNDSGPGSLRHAIANAASNSTILVESNVKEIKLTSRLEISKNLTIQGNGVTITRDSSWVSIGNTTQLLYVSNTSATVSISRVHFKDGRSLRYSGAIYHYQGNLNLESCIFSGNTCRNMGMGDGGAIHTGAGSSLSIKGCTFYGNSSNIGGAIYNNGMLTLAGNLFYGNTAEIGYVVYSSATVVSNGYNAVDVPFGTSTSGWTAKPGDVQISDLPISSLSFRIISGRGAANVISALPIDYPETDFYGSEITNGAAAGAVQSMASGYYLEIADSVGTGGKVSVSPQPNGNADGLSSGMFFFTASPAAGSEFRYWLVNGTNQGTTNPLSLTLTDHTRVEAVFEAVITNNERVIEVLFTEQEATVNVGNLNGNDIYLVKVNLSALNVDATNTGGVQAISPNLLSEILSYTPDKLAPMDHPAIMEFNANPPPIVEMPRRSRAVFVPPVVGDTRMFWVMTGSAFAPTYVQKRATLRVVGQYGNIWVLDENYNSTIEQRVQALADKFDQIYPVETNLLGYEYGGGPGGDGGKDGDPKVQILIYDIPEAGGYFSSADFYEQYQTTRSNMAEIFYLDSGQPLDYLYSALIHEFQHMINFNMKTVKHEKSSASWYNEMLSMMAEDVIGPLVGIPTTNSVHPIRARIPTFLGSYNEVGITEWVTLGDSSYAQAYAFGAYLLRNYGGPVLLQKILANNTTNIDSITAALQELNGSTVDFNQALSRYGEALIFSGSSMPYGVNSFDRAVPSIVNGTIYTAYGFDIWNDFSRKGPTIFNLTQTAMRLHSVNIQHASTWINKTGTYSITLERPADPNIKLFLMVK